MTAQTNESVYFPALDATRFMAFIPVFLTHCFIIDRTTLIQHPGWENITSFLNKGVLGLDYFFVLSAFLITYLMLYEFQQKRKINLVAFFIRRCLRIWPLYFVFVGLGFAFCYLKLSHAPLPPLFYFVSFTLNFYIVQNGFDFLFFLVFLWSISVEEQFYIVVGLLFKLLSKFNFLKYCTMITGLLLIAISIVFRYSNVDGTLNLYFNTLSVTGNFGVGIILAHCAFYYPRFVLFFERLKKPSIILFNLVFFLVIFFYLNLFNKGVSMIFERLIFSLFFAVIVALHCFSNHTLFNFRQRGKLDELGKISLGLYFFHGLVIAIFSYFIAKEGIHLNAISTFVIIPLLMFVITIISASLSYKWFEKPMLAFKSKFYS